MNRESDELNVTETIRLIKNETNELCTDNKIALSETIQITENILNTLYEKLKNLLANYRNDLSNETIERIIQKQSSEWKYNLIQISDQQLYNQINYEVKISTLQQHYNQTLNSFQMLSNMSKENNSIGKPHETN